MFCDSDDWVKRDYCKDMLQYYSDDQLLMCDIEIKEKDRKKITDQSIDQEIYIEEIS